MSDEKREAMERMARADKAKELIDNPLYIEAITVIKASMYAEFENTKLIDEDQRKELWQRMQLMKLFEGRFESIVKHGAKAQQTINMIEMKENQDANNS